MHLKQNQLTSEIPLSFQTISSNCSFLADFFMTLTISSHVSLPAVINEMQPYTLIKV